MTYMSGIRAVGFALLGFGAAPVLAQNLTVSAEAEAVFNLAAELYPDLFVNGSELREAAGYTYRVYGTGVYVGIKDNEISLRGGPFGGNIVNKGSVATVLDFLTDLKADVSVTPTADMLAVFDLAAQLQPSLFGQSSELRTSADGYLYRYYPGSNIYAAIRNGSVFLKGGIFGNFYTSRGDLNAVVTALRAQVANNPNPNPIPAGDYTLTVTGTVSGTTSAGGMSFPIPATAINLTIADMAAPNTADLESIKDTFFSSIQDVEGMVVNSASVTVINNTANLIEFTMQVSATISTTTPAPSTSSFNYDLRYKYVK